MALLRPRPRRRSALPALLAAVALSTAACGGASAGAGPGLTGATSPAPASSSAADSATGSAAAGTTTTVTSLTAFRSPSGNIGCQLAPVDGGSSFARCDLATVTWHVAAPAGGCALDWGGGADGHGSVGLGEGPASALCVGDTVADPAARVLAYGAALRMGDLVCTSRESGMECEDTATGHGFTAARERVDLH